MKVNTTKYNSQSLWIKKKGHLYDVLNEHIWPKQQFKSLALVGFQLFQNK